jgi:presenilin-like A22 family membrane protease
MKRPSDSLIGTFAGLLIVYLAQSSRMHPEEGLSPGLVLVPLIGAIIGTIVGRIRDRSA